jgi:c-di-GMP-binding flagellar brake protein YcgR
LARRVDLANLPGNLPGSIVSSAKRDETRSRPAETRIKSHAVDALFLQGLCRRITPVSLRWGEKDVRRRTFLVGSEWQAGELVLEVDPVRAWSRSSVPAVLDFVFGEQQFWLAGRLNPSARENAARLSIDRGPELRPPRARRLVPEGEVAFALSRTEIPGLTRLSQPIVDIGARTLRVESNLPLEVGTVLTDLVVVHQQRTIRHCEGVVASCAGIIYPDERRLYECVIRLRAPRGSSAEPPTFRGNEIDDPVRVRALLWGLSDLGHEVSIFSGGETYRARLVSAQGDRSVAPELRCHLEDTNRIVLRSGVVTVECSLFGSGYRFYARIIGRRGDLVSLSPAPKLHECHRRDEDRTRIRPDASVTVTFRHPFQRKERVRPVVDLSSGGFAFDAMDEDDELWPELPLTDVRIELPAFRLEVPVAVVRAVTARRCSVEISNLPATDLDALRGQLVDLGPQPLQLHDGNGLDQIVRFHHEMALLEPEMEANLQATRLEAERSWRIAHRGPAGLMRTAVIPWHGEIGATLTSVRAYERTWILQHSAVASPSVPTGAGQLHGLLMRLAAQRDDGEYVAGIIDAGAKALHGMVNTFFSECVPAHRGASPLTLYAAEALTDPETETKTETPIRRLQGDDELIVEHVGQRHLDPVCARALSLRAGEIELPRTRAAYRRLGIERERRAYGAFAEEACVAVLLAETASAGLCLSGLLSASMYFPVLPHLDPDGSKRRALCDFARARPLAGSPQYRFLFAPRDIDAAPLVASGFRALGGCTFFALHRMGLLDYQRYVANKYGLLQARLRGRPARVPDAA